MSWFTLVRVIAAFLLVLTPGALVVATGEIDRALSASSVVDYLLLVSALVCPMLGALLLLKVRSPREQVPAQLRTAVDVLRALGN